MKKLSTKLLFVLVAIILSTASLFACAPKKEQARTAEIKNIIFMIPDGGGFDNFTLASEVKQALFEKGLNKMPNARTTLTKDALANYGYDNVTGLYLDEFIIGAAKTESFAASNSDKYKITDSSAAGTALATGHKTVYGFAGISKDKKPIASLTELAQSKNMSTGVVTTKSFVDATPLAFFSAHSIHRKEYQDNSYQALTSGVDVLIGEGTEYGDILKEGQQSSHPDVYASKLGYTVAKNKEQMQSAVNSGTKKLWASISGMANTAPSKPTNIDNATNVIAYDVDSSKTNPSLLEMTQAALTTLSDNINNENGFFLMVEGGALDNAAESSRLRYAIGEALAFDETFGYCVKWAKEHGDNTLVIAVADHDSGGFSGIENYKDALIDLIINGKNDNGSVSLSSKLADYQKLINAGSEMTSVTGHTAMPVPISLYIPKNQQTKMLKELGLPTNIDRTAIRYQDKPKYYSLESVNENYLIDNTSIAHAIASVSELGSLDNLSSQMFVEVARYKKGVPVSDFEQLGKLEFSNKNSNAESTYYDVTFTTFDGKFKAFRNQSTCILDGKNISVGKIGQKQLKALYVVNTQTSNETIYQTGSFYLPKCILEQVGLSIN